MAKKETKIVVVTLVGSAAAIALAAGIVIYTGLFNVAANEPHWPLTQKILEFARNRSIQVHAAGLTPPRGYDEASKIVLAVGHFSEHCAFCHGTPGAKRSEVAEGMLPQPPDLKMVADRYRNGELFWILKNGIKMSGMPSMASDGDEMLWATVAFLEKLRGLSDDEYNDLWMQSQAAENKMDHGSMPMSGMSKGVTGPGGPSEEDHSAHGQPKGPARAKE